MTLLDSYQTCDDCNLEYDTWVAVDSLWNEVMGSSAGMLCVRCFGIRAAKEGFKLFLAVYPYPVHLEEA